MKTIASPRAVFIARKTSVWTVKPSPGPHNSENALSLSTALKGLGSAMTKKDVKALLNARSVRIDGHVVKELKTPVGLMDVVDVEGKNLRVLVDLKGRLTLKETKNPRFKVCRVEKKWRTKGGKIHIALHDGKSLFDYVCSVGDSVCISIPDLKPVERIALDAGADALIVHGKHAGKFVKIETITPGTQTRASEVLFTHEGEKFKTPREYVFPVKNEYI
jgi:small subunit ribosomal protein S4e